MEPCWSSFACCCCHHGNIDAIYKGCVHSEEPRSGIRKFKACSIPKIRHLFDGLWCNVILLFSFFRTLVWVSVIFLPLLGIVWILLILNVSERLPLLPLVLSLAVVIQAAYTLAGFCFVNARVRRNLYVSLLKCCGKDVPKDLDLSVDAIGSSSNIASDRPTSAVKIE